MLAVGNKIRKQLRHLISMFFMSLPWQGEGACPVAARCGTV